MLCPNCAAKTDDGLLKAWQERYMSKVNVSDELAEDARNCALWFFERGACVHDLMGEEASEMFSSWWDQHKPREVSREENTAWGMMLVAC
jgi:hypothetical protein